VTEGFDGPRTPDGGADPAATGVSTGPERNDSAPAGRDQAGRTDRATPGTAPDRTSGRTSDSTPDSTAASSSAAPRPAAGGAAPGAATDGRGAKGRLGPSPAVAVWFLLPAFILLGAWVVYPIIYSLVRSLYDADGDNFVGLGNYISIFTDPGTLTTIRNNLIWVLVAPALVTLLGLIFAVLSERIRWVTAFKLILFMPMAVSFLASGVIFRLVYDADPDKGVANAIITTVRDVFRSDTGYPGARPRENDAAPVAAEQSGAVVTKQAAQPGEVVLVPLVGLPPAQVAEAAPAKAAQPQPGSLTGTVWLDFTQGGGGTVNQVDDTEKGLAGITVEAVADGQVRATTTTAEDGTFAFENLPPGSYTVRLPQENFTAPFNGLQWLGPTLITPAIIGAYIWVYAGFAMVLIAAGLSAIPRDALEAARIDGATEWQVFRRITVPLLSPVLLVVFVTMIINVLKVFDLVFVIAPGSVQPQANVIALEMWRVSFGGGNNQGLGSALAIFLLILVLPFMFFNIRRFRREQQ
jgi:ABC-type sugar transport systems, permease components